MAARWTSARGTSAHGDKAGEAIPTSARTAGPPPALTPDPAQSAIDAGLRYVSDEGPGMGREAVVPKPRSRKVDPFRYRTAAGVLVKDATTLKRIRSLVIPPAWTKVWICPRPDGHIQATGRDARGRKQYRYHPRWREVRDETKYHRMLAFADALPRIRARAEKDLGLRGLPREKILATVVRLLETTLIRVGNEEYARTNHSFGLTTLENRHVDVHGSTVTFSFRGKSGKRHHIDLHDARLARIVHTCETLPGHELFQYQDTDGSLHRVESSDVNAYIHEASGESFTAKDFRTWAGTVLAAMALREFEKFDSQAQAKKNVVAAIKSVSERLGNTPSVCRKCYVHPAIFEGYLDGHLVETLQQRASAMLREKLRALKPEEAAVVAFLQGRLTRDAEPLQAKLVKSLAKVKAKGTSGSLASKRATGTSGARGARRKAA